MHHENPYRATLTGKTKIAGTRVATAIWWLVYLHPAISLALIYTCWMLTTTALGRPPAFGEHPKNDLSHIAVHVLKIPAAVLAIAAPVFVPLALGWGLIHPFAKRSLAETTTKNRFVCLTAYILMLAITASLYSSDPYGAVYWFWD